MPRHLPLASRKPELRLTACQCTSSPWYAVMLATHDRAAAAGRPLLTADGAQYLKELVAGHRAAVGQAPTVEFPDVFLPIWDAERRRLWFDSRLVKVFRQPAPQQTAILDAFQAFGWAVRHVRNPLPGCDDLSATRQRLHEAIKNLNRGLAPDTIRFHGDGTGDGVWWASAASSFDAIQSAGTTG